MLEAVRRQYERFPYPPLPWLALPARSTGGGLNFNHGLALTGRSGSARGIRILVAGAGTLEALVVAQQHPQAAEVVAVDLSAPALALSRRRERLRRFTDTLSLRRWSGRGLPPMRYWVGDLTAFDEGPFDYILASNVLHHHPQPGALLGHLARLLSPQGLLRLRTYPRASRIWVRHLAHWLGSQGLVAQQADLAHQVAGLVGGLPQHHPLRYTYAQHGDVGQLAGLVDACFHACEHPLAPLAWGRACAEAGLVWLAEDQHPLARGETLTQFWPDAPTDPWLRLQLMDDLLELSSSPILWLGRGAASAPPAMPQQIGVTSAEPDALVEGLAPAEVAQDSDRTWRLPSAHYAELAQAWRRILGVIGEAHATQLLGRARAFFAPRAEGRLLAGYTLAEYTPEQLTAMPPPWGEAQWRALQALRPGGRLHYQGSALPGADLWAQAQGLQLNEGLTTPWLDELRLG